MIVAELIKFLEKQPQHAQVAYSKYSDQCLMELDEIQLIDGCKARPDGWVQSQRPDMPTEKYLLFPGN